MSDEKKAFVKHDGGKMPMHLVPPVAVERMAEVLDHGARKYAPDNWRRVGDDWRQRYTSAALRHLFADMRGDRVDADSGHTHLAHALTNLAFLVELADKRDAAPTKDDLADVDVELAKSLRDYTYRVVALDAESRKITAHRGSRSECLVFADMQRRHHAITRTLVFERYDGDRFIDLVRVPADSFAMDMHVLTAATKA